MAVLSLMDPRVEEKLLRVALEVASQQGRRTANAVAAAVEGAFRRQAAAEPAGADGVEEHHARAQAATRGVRVKQRARVVQERGGLPQQQTCADMNEINKAHLVQVRGGLPQKACTTVDEHIEAHPAQERGGLPQRRACADMDEFNKPRVAQVGVGSPSRKPVPT